jgi:ribonucleoside-triphosphate reductase (formate)
MSNEVNTLEQKRTQCEVYSRVVGYITPINRWNDGKRAEFDQRVEFENCETC